MLGALCLNFYRSDTTSALTLHTQNSKFFNPLPYEEHPKPPSLSIPQHQLQNSNIYIIFVTILLRTSTPHLFGNYTNARNSLGFFM